MRLLGCVNEAFLFFHRADRMLRCACKNRCAKVASCVAFLTLLPSQRRMKAIDLRLCTNCLSRSHFADRCPSTQGCHWCSLRHHSTLHEENQPRPVVAPLKPSLADGSVQTDQDERFDLIKQETVFAMDCLKNIQRLPRDRDEYVIYAVDALNQILKCLP